MRTIGWVVGLLRRRPLELLTAAVSVALGVALIASLGAFVTQSHSALTVRAAATVPVDWQVQVTPQGKGADVAKAVAKLADVRATRSVSYAKVPALESSAQGGARQTGAAYVVSLPNDYAATFPRELRSLVGADKGVLLLQQTAANLAVAPGASFFVKTAHGRKRLTADGVVEMPYADSFFQVVGLAPGTGASAPPDNVVLVSPAKFDAIVGSTSAVVDQLHVSFRHDRLPNDPTAAALLVQGRAKHLQVAVAGGALIGDNLGTALTAAGSDARYADLLFFLLGLPALVLAVVVAALVMSLRSTQRRREIALLRLRGAGTPVILRLVGAEGILTGLVGVALGIPAALLAIRLALPSGAGLSPRWSIAAGVGGLTLAVAVQAADAFRMIFGQRSAVAAEAVRLPRTSNPWPLRAGLDVVLLAAAAVAFALTAHGGYNVVVAPEGVPLTQVNYGALAGPALAWPGLTLLVWRLTAWAMGRRTGAWSRARSGFAPELEASAIRQRRRIIARGAAGLGASLGLVMSTAVFTATYDQQARVDVALTVGSDVAVVQSPASSAGPEAATDLAGADGVKAVEPLMHRFAYVGPDLQDIYGVQPATFARVAPLQDAFVPGSNVKTALRQLGSTPDGVLLSAETLHDYQLHPGDLIRIRLQTGPDRAYRPVDFHVLGQVTEWPTAPKDSFIVANADYLASVTGSDAIGTFLVSTDTPARTAASIRSSHNTSGADIQDTSTGSALVTSASGLAATDLTGLSRIELGFGLLMALACSGLALLVGIIERRRALVLLAALGATARQRRRFLSGEARGLVLWGAAGGLVIGATIAYMLVKVLTGIFDPPPAGASVPWGFLSGMVVVVIVVSSVVVSLAGRLAARAGPSALRDL